MYETISTPLVSFGGSTVAGFLIGMLLKKVLRIVLIVVGSFLSFLFLAIQFMAHRGYLGNTQIDWNRIGTDVMTWIQGLAVQISGSHIFGALGIEATSGLGIGLALGLAKG